MHSLHPSVAEHSAPVSADFPNHRLPAGGMHFLHPSVAEHSAPVSADFPHRRLQTGGMHFLPLCAFEHLALVRACCPAHQFQARGVCSVSANCRLYAVKTHQVPAGAVYAELPVQPLRRSIHKIGFHLTAHDRTAGNTECFPYPTSRFSVFLQVIRCLLHHFCID